MGDLGAGLRWDCLVGRVRSQLTLNLGTFSRVGQILSYEAFAQRSGGQHTKTCQHLLGHDPLGRGRWSGFGFRRFALGTHLVAIANTHAGERLLYRLTGCDCRNGGRCLGRLGKLEVTLVLSGAHLTLLLRGGILLGLTEGGITADLRLQLVSHLGIERLLTEATTLGCRGCKLQGTLAGVGWRFVLQRRQIVVLHLSTNLFVCRDYGFSGGHAPVDQFLGDLADTHGHRVNFLGRGLALGHDITEQVRLLRLEGFVQRTLALGALHVTAVEERHLTLVNFGCGGFFGCDLGLRQLHLVHLASVLQHVRFSAGQFFATSQLGLGGIECLGVGGTLIVRCSPSHIVHAELGLCQFTREQVCLWATSAALVCGAIKINTLG